MHVTVHVTLHLYSMHGVHMQPYIQTYRVKYSHKCRPASAVLMDMFAMAIGVACLKLCMYTQESRKV